jgi:hypothetical protein
MLSIIKPFGIGKVADRFKDIFHDSDLTYAHFCSLIAMYLFGLKSICEVVRVCGWAKSPSSLSRAVNDFLVGDKKAEIEKTNVLPLEETKADNILGNGISTNLLPIEINNNVQI